MRLIAMVFIFLAVALLYVCVTTVNAQTVQKNEPAINLKTDASDSKIRAVMRPIYQERWAGNKNVAVIIGQQPVPSLAKSEPKVVDAKFAGLVLGATGSTIFDIEGTFRCKNNGTCKEANPLMRPFINSGRPAAYAVSFGITGAATLLSYKMRKSRKKGWWAPLVVLTGAHAVAGGLSFRF